jgi:fructose transport system ATP-binding protein
MMTGTSGAPVLEARGLVKKYGHVTAINGADFELREGEVLAVIGDNGAGKTSLIKALAGAVVPDSGEILMNGTPVSFKNTRDARAAGIETVYQDLAMVPLMSIGGTCTSDARCDEKASWAACSADWTCRECARRRRSTSRT